MTFSRCSSSRDVKFFKSRLSLPDDLLYTIFLLVSQQEFQFYRENAQHPWNFAGVCKQWRAVCLSSQMLWTKLTTFNHTCKLFGAFEDSRVCVNGLSLRRCYLQLERSGKLPLEVDSRSFELLNCKRSIIRTIATQRHRWKALFFHADAKSLEEFPKLILYKENLHALQSLQYHCRTTSQWRFTLPFGPESLTGLTMLFITHWQGHGHTNTAQFPWARLQKLHLDDYRGTPSSLLAMLSKCHDLECFRLHSSDLHAKDSDENLSTFAPDNLILHKLTHLDIDIRKSDCLYYILPYIRTPAVQTLFLGRLGSVDIQVVTDLVVRSDCKIISFDMAFFYRPGMQELLQKLECLEELAIRGWEETSQDDASECNEILAPLIRVEGSPFYHPRLRRLSIVNLQIDPDLLIQVIDSRLNPAPEREEEFVPLQRLEFAYFPGAEGSDVLFQFYASMLYERLFHHGPKFGLVFDPKAFRTRQRLERVFQ